MTSSVHLNTRTFAVNRVASLPPAMQPGVSLVYKRSGSLLLSAFNSSRIWPLFSVVLEYEKPLSKGKGMQYNLTSTTVGTIAGMDLTDKGTTVLYTNQGPSVLTYNLDKKWGGPVGITIPNANCTAVVALYGGGAIVGCADADQTTSRYWAYLVGEQEGEEVVKRRWCAPDADNFYKERSKAQVLSAVSLAMDVNRQHFYLSFVGTHLPASFPTLYKIRISDFKQVANSSMGIDIVGMTVSGAIPANQQDCPVNYVHCCTASGRPVAAGVVCYTSTDPCQFDSVCDGEKVTCPSRTYADNGTPCSFEPYGLFKPAYGHPDWKGKLGMTQEDADREDAHKCYGCSSGWCVPFQGVKAAHGRGLRGGIKAGVRSIVVGPTASDMYHTVKLT